MTDQPRRPTDDEMADAAALFAEMSRAVDRLLALVDPAHDRQEES